MKQKLAALLIGAVMFTAALPIADTPTALPAAAETSEANDIRTAFFERIAGWENTTLDNCVILPSQYSFYETELLTPTKPYKVDRTSYAFTRPCRVYLAEGTALDADAILEKWCGLLRAAGFSEESLPTSCTVTESEDGYLEVQPLGSTQNLKFIDDCLASFPQVTRIEVQAGYYTSSRPNTASDFVISMHKPADRELTAADFPALTGVQLADTCYIWQEPTGDLYLTLDSLDYADYFEAVKYLTTLDFVEGLQLEYVTTALADLSEDAQSPAGWETVYEREIPLIPVYGNHSGYNDPLFNEYIISSEIPADIECYFTGQIFMKGEDYYSDSGIEFDEKGQPLAHWKERTLIARYNDWSYGVYLYSVDDPLTFAEAQELCAEIEANTEENPQFVFCKKMPCTLTGDLNGDNQVTITDAKSLLDYSVMWSSFNNDPVPLLQTLPTADVNGDGIANINDAKCILNFSVYRLTFGTEPEWSAVCG